MTTRKATKAASKAITKAGPGTSIANIDDQLANEIANLKNQIGAPTGNKIKIEATGDFVLPDGMNLGSEIQIAVIDFYSRNHFYHDAFNPNAISPPDCYAIGKDRSLMAPEDDSPDKQNDKCATCPMNQFGSGSNGKSKACQNRYWVAVLLVDPDNPDAHNEPGAPIYILDLSPSNLKSFEGAVSHASRALGHWAKALYTVVAKNVGTYAQVTFIDPVPNQDYAQHVARRPEAEPALTRHPDFAAAAAAPAPTRGRGQPARRAAGARR